MGCRKTMDEEVGVLSKLDPGGECGKFGYWLRVVELTFFLIF